MRRVAAAAAAILVALVGSACASSATSTPTSTSTSTKLAGLPQGAEWRTPAMTSLINAARQEGKLVIVAGTNDVQYTSKVWQQFGQAFGIAITTISGSPDEVTSRIIAERQQGLNPVDIGILGGGGTSRLLDAHLFQPLTPQMVMPEVTDRSSGWRLNYIPWDAVDTQQKYCTNTLLDPGTNVPKIYYNTQNVTAADLAQMQTWSGLLNPKWKGKIVLGDVATGVDESDIAPSWVSLGKPFFSQLLTTMNVSVEPSGDDLQMANGLARGQWDFALFPGSDVPFASAQKQGLPVALLPSNVLKPGAPATLGGRLCMFSKPAHPAAAKLFVNWAMSRAGQTAYNELDTRPDEVALRSDVPRGNVSQATWSVVNTPGLVVFDQNKYPSAYNDALDWWKQEFQTLKLSP
jgi:iron(III) transport system substrate-binding protein